MPYGNMTGGENFVLGQRSAFGKNIAKEFKGSNQGKRQAALSSFMFEQGANYRKQQKALNEAFKKGSKLNNLMSGPYVPKATSGIRKGYKQPTGGTTISEMAGLAKDTPTFFNTLLAGSLAQSPVKAIGRIAEEFTGDETTGNRLSKSVLDELTAPSDGRFGMAKAGLVNMTAEERRVAGNKFYADQLKANEEKAFAKEVLAPEFTSDATYGDFIDTASWFSPGSFLKGLKAAGKAGSVGAKAFGAAPRQARLAGGLAAGAGAYAGYNELKPEEADASAFSAAAKAASAATRTKRGAFESPQYGLGALAEIITGDPTLTSFVAQRYPRLAKLARQGQPIFRGIEGTPESQVPYFENTGRSGFERPNRFLNMQLPQFGTVLDRDLASANDLSIAARGRPFDFGSPRPSTKSVEAALETRRFDLGPLSSSFGFIVDPSTRTGRRPVTAGREHPGGSAYQGANITGQLLDLVTETHNLDEIAPIVTKFEKNGAAALSPDELFLVDAFFNEKVKGTLPYEVARPIGLEKGGLALERQLGDDALTHFKYTDYLDRMNIIDPLLVDPERMMKFAKTVKPRVRFGKNTFGTGKDAVDPSELSPSALFDLGELLRLR